MNKKILPQYKLKKILCKLKKKRKKIVFTNGCFDILHRGHIDYLSKTKRLGDILVIGLNSDNSIKKIKGKNRPIIKELDRAEILAALEGVDFITIFNEETPLNLINLLKPDILVKGTDWNKKDIIGGDIVTAYGGKIRTIKFLAGYSTTSIIHKIKTL